MDRRPNRAGALLFTGDVFCDLIFTGAAVPQPGQETYAERFAIAAGGAAIRAVAAARLGADSRLVATMGDDPIGVHVQSLLHDEPNLDLEELATVRGYQTPISVALSGPLDRGFVTYVEPHAVAVPRRRNDVAVMHVGVDDAASPWAVEMRERGTLVVGGVGWDATGEWSSELLGRLSMVDVFIPNHDEAMAYAHTTDPLTAARALADRVGLVIVTRGADGVVAVDARHGEQVEVAGIRVPTLDTTGAGDVFAAALMTSFLEDWTLSERLRFATATAAYSVTGLGGGVSAPRPSQLVALADRYASGGDWAFLHDWMRRTSLQQTTGAER